MAMPSGSRPRSDAEHRTGAAATEPSATVTPVNSTGDLFEIPTWPLHDVHADNRSENVFGWVQPEEWETVAGPNKDLFMRGQCVECQAGPSGSRSSYWSSGQAKSDPSAWSELEAGRSGSSDVVIGGLGSSSDALGSCGGPSCGYGAACCEYSRNASCAIPSLPTGSKPAGSSVLPIFRDGNGDGEPTSPRKGADLGVSLLDIIHGRSCRPISLLDLRTFLLLQRQPHRRHPSYIPASDMLQSSLPDLDVLGELDASKHHPLSTTTTTASPASAPAGLAASPPTTSHSSSGPKGKGRFDGVTKRQHDEVDALDFLVAFERYKKKFRDLPKSERLRSPDALTCQAAMDAFARKHGGTAGPSPDGSRSQVAAEETDDPSQPHADVSRRPSPQEVGLSPALQPLRRELDRIVSRYLGSPTDSTPATEQRRPKRRFRLPHRNESDSSSSTAVSADEADGIYKQSAEATLNRSIRVAEPHLQWMVEVGLVSQQAIHLALTRAQFTSHPDALAPLAETVSAYMSTHVVPFFFISIAKNLSRPTSRGRLAVGLVCLAIAIVFTTLLLLRPSPLAPNANGGTGEINRWWRLTLFPIWALALGYVLAYRTGVCVWLTLRGHREPDEEEEREREQIRSRFSDDAAGFSFAEVEADAELRDDEVERKTNRWMAPELASLLLTGKMPRFSQSSGPRPSMSESSRANSLQLRRGRSSSLAGLADARPPFSAAAFKHSACDSTEELSETVELPQFSRSRSVDLGARAKIARVSPRSGRKLSVQGGSEAMSSTQSNSSMTDIAAPGPASATLIRPRRVPLLPITVGVVRSPGKVAADALEGNLQGLSDSTLHSPVVTRDALLFDPELARAVHQAANRRPSVAVASTATARAPNVAAAIPSDIPTLAAPFSCQPPSKARETASSVPPSIHESRPGLPSAISYGPVVEKTEPASLDLEATTPRTAHRRVPLVRAILRRLDRAIDQTSTGLRRWTGFAVGTEKVLDARVRRAQQIGAIKAMAYDFGATFLIMVVLLAVP